MKTKNIIFDLGGVVIDLDFQRTFSAFAAMTNADFEHLFNLFLKGKNQTPTFLEDYETGSISDAVFRDKMRHQFDLNATDEAIDTAWNAMLLDVPATRANFIKTLRKRFKVFALSNTNAIHQHAFEAILAQNPAVESINALFDKTYYSHHLGDRKPNVSIFQRVLDENQLIASETIFIDDTLQHIEGAKKAGINAIHLPRPQTIDELLKDL